MKKYLIALVAFFTCAVAFAYDNLTPAPDDIVGFVTWIMGQVQVLKAGDWQIATGFGIAAALGIFKFVSKTFSVQMEKLGSWQFIIPIVLGAIGEFVLNIPKPFQWLGVLPAVITGATGSGLMAIAFYHIHKKFPFGTALLQFIQNLVVGIFKKKEIPPQA